MDDEEAGGHAFLTDQNEHNSLHDANRKVEITVTWRDVWYQIVASNLGYIFTVHSGINLSFSNLLLNEFDKETTSWFASIIGLSTPIGSCLGGPLMDKFGRKGANLVAACPCLLSWILIYQAGNDDIMFLYFARFLAGIAGGLLISNVVYVSEISHKNYRPMFLSLLSFYFSFGILLTTLLQSFLTWRQTALFNFVFFTVAFFMVALFTPESPIWLASFRSDLTGAKRSLRRLIANEKVFEAEWARLQDSIRLSREAKSTDEAGQKLKISSRIVGRPLCILFVLFVLQQCSCVYMVVMYALKLFPLISPHVSEFVTNWAFILFGILRFVSSIVGSVLSFKCGRKTLLMSSCAGMTVACGAMVVVVALQHTPSLMSANLRHASSTVLVFEWISLLTLLLFVCFGTYGVMSIPWTLIVELLPNRMRSVGSAVLVSYAYLLMFLCAKIFPFAIEKVNVCLVFLFLTVVSAIFCVFVHFCVPETLGKSFAEIEQHFRRRRRSAGSKSPF